MAPPKVRGSSSNRKAQMSVFTGYLIAGAGAAIGAALLIISLWQPQALAGLRSMASDAAAPAGKAGAGTRVGGQSFFEAIAGYYRAGSKNAELEQEVKVARVRLAEAAALKAENARLKATLGLRNEDQKPVALGRLIGSTSASTRRFAFISVGTADGVTAEMPVVSPLGLVGRVLEAGRHSARVMLLTDSESTIPVRRATDDVVAFAQGQADGTLRLRLINLGLNPLKKGDVFVTSGAGGLFRPNIAVAVVVTLTKDGAIARMLSNPAATDYVAVEPIWQPDAIRMLSVQPAKAKNAP
jgi:rod shape-determining protein MreC